MLSDQQMTTLRKIAMRLRKLTTDLGEIDDQIEEQRILLPERLWHSEIDDEMENITGLLQEAFCSIDDAVDHIAEVTGEKLESDLPPPPLPDKLPMREEQDARRREMAAAIRKQRKG